MLSLPGCDFPVTLPSSMVVEEIYALVETQSAEEKAAKDKCTKELIAAYRNRQNMVIDAKTKAECIEVLIQTQLHLSQLLQSF